MTKRGSKHTKGCRFLRWERLDGKVLLSGSRSVCCMKLRRNMGRRRILHGWRQPEPAFFLDWSYGSDFQSAALRIIFESFDNLKNELTTAFTCAIV